MATSLIDRRFRFGYCSSYLATGVESMVQSGSTKGVDGVAAGEQPLRDRVYVVGINDLNELNLANYPL